MQTRADIELEPAFRRLSEAARADPYPSRYDREHRLRRLERAIQRYEGRLCAAIGQDFGHRSEDETRLLEMFPSLEAVRHALRHLQQWMRDERRRTSMWFLPGRSRIVRQPLGVVGIVVPWNYPLFLAISPLAGALAAGNRVMVKTSELVPRTSEVLAEMMSRAFPDGQVVVIDGDVDRSRAFVSLPFDHLLFTGSTTVGREVMGRAAANLTPVTLELGGKSPALLAPDYPIGRAVERLLVGKLMNAGQTCVAPDYVLLSSGDLKGFVEEAKARSRALYPGGCDSADYSSIISAGHWDRLNRYLEEAMAEGARVEPLFEGAEPIRERRRFPPVLVIGAPNSCALMREEIFGPILPVVTYTAFDQAIAYINDRPRPLAMYVFDRDRRRVHDLLRNTVAGGVTVNDVLLHLAQEDLPFGGVGASGMGQYHGWEGFLAFSQSKSVFYQSRVNALGLLKPPYGPRFRSLVRLLLR